MDECPVCGTWTLVYYPQIEYNVCLTCGYKHYEKYEDYLKRVDCSKDLIKTSITFTVKKRKKYRTKDSPCCESGKTWLGCKLTRLRGRCAYGYRW